MSTPQDPHGGDRDWGRPPAGGWGAVGPSDPTADPPTPAMGTPAVPPGGGAWDAAEAPRPADPNQGGPATGPSQEDPSWRPGGASDWAPTADSGRSAAWDREAGSRDTGSWAAGSWDTGSGAARAGDGASRDGGSGGAGPWDGGTARTAEGEGRGGSAAWVEGGGDTGAAAAGWDPTGRHSAAGRSGAGQQGWDPAGGAGAGQQGWDPAGGAGAGQQGWDPARGAGAAQPDGRETGAGRRGGWDPRGGAGAAGDPDAATAAVTAVRPRARASSGSGGRRRLPLLIGGIVGVLVVAAVLVVGFWRPGYFLVEEFDQQALQAGVTQVLSRDYGLEVTALSCPEGQRVTAGTSFTCAATVDGENVDVPITVLNDDGTYQVGRV